MKCDKCEQPTAEEDATQPMEFIGFHAPSELKQRLRIRAAIANHSMAEEIRDLIAHGIAHREEQGAKTDSDTPREASA
jgi:hypothetical protein